MGADRGVGTEPRRRWALRVAGGVYLANAIGFGVGAVLTLPYLARHGSLPMTPFGFRAFSGPFEALGWRWFSVLGWVFVGLCALEALAGVRLLRGERGGVVLGVATTPAAIVLGGGFALPLYLAGIPLRAALLFLGRRAPGVPTKGGQGGRGTPSHAPPHPGARTPGVRLVNPASRTNQGRSNGSAVL